MQLKKNKNRSISQALTQASALLVGAATPMATHAGDHGWQVDAGVLYYKEDGKRVQAIEPAVNLRKGFGHDRVLNLKLVVDSLTGASPNGARPASVPQTFTSPSGDRTYAIDAGELPVYEEFKDTRYAIAAGWQQPIFGDLLLQVGGHYSTEYDFQSASVNAALAKDVNNKNTTLSVGVSTEFDSIDPVGGAPEPLAGMVAKNAVADGGSKTKTVFDILLGVTQVLSRRTLLLVNYGLSLSNGYQNDPYKFLSVVNASNDLIVDPHAANAELQNLYLFESRPDSRTEHSLYAELKYHLSEDVVDVSYRFTTGDWGINSHTLDLKYRWELGRHVYLQPHLRWYTQSEADFYRSFLRLGQDVKINGRAVTPLIEFASPDSRLGAFDATTFGAKIGYQLGRDSEISFRIEKYDQNANAPDAPATGPLAGQVMQPDLSAIIVQVGYSFRW